ncbi:MAG: hypothetical protein Q9M32_05480 [Sulfurimonas sp.]|nr:hypothetical protein [Sulfurimonas sp.]MDQ7061586.1 hypothetical protein [Sulfurimonas sp.]
MLNINELESKWIRYKIKSYIPYFVIASSLITIILITSLVDFSITPEAKVSQKKEPLIQEAIIEKEVLVIKDTPKKVILIEKFIPLKEETQKFIIKPSLGFMNNIKRTSPQHYKEETIIETPRFVKAKKVKKVIEEDILVEAPEVEIVQNTTISIQRQNTHEDIQHIIKRFKKSNNPALSLFVAKKYYDLENYNQAYNYALITNELNNDIEESWIIFSKSLVKLGKKEKAIEILKKYINNSHSQRAKILLDNIRSGKIK